MKLVIVGGGSTYTPEVVDGIARMHAMLPVAEVVLVDPAFDRLNVVAEFSKRLLAHKGNPYQLTTERNLRAALEGADLVLIQIRVGGQTIRKVDESFPLEYKCIGQETTGAGGLAKALRTIPIVLEIARQVREVAPTAWILNFTNPVGIVTRALLRDGHRAVGLCNVAIAMEDFFARLLGVTHDQVSAGHIGLNHLTWETQVLVDGEDVLGDLIRRESSAIAERVKLPAALIESVGVVPSYYLQFYYSHDVVVRESLDGPTRAEVVEDIENELIETYQDMHVVTKPAALANRGGALYSEAAVQLAASLIGRGTGRHAVNVANMGKLGFLPDDAVIETVADVSKDHISVTTVPPLPTEAHGLISAVYAYEDLALHAGLEGGRERVVRALLAHPLIGQWDLAVKLADRLISENRDYLSWTK